MAGYRALCPPSRETVWPSCFSAWIQKPVLYRATGLHLARALRSNTAPLKRKHDRWHVSPNHLDRDSRVGRNRRADRILPTQAPVQRRRRTSQPIAHTLDCKSGRCRVFFPSGELDGIQGVLGPAPAVRGRKPIDLLLLSDAMRRRAAAGLQARTVSDLPVCNRRPGQRRVQNDRTLLLPLRCPSR